MADGATSDPGSGGVTWATDDDGTFHHPYSKIEFGADNTQTPVSAANPLPTDWAGTDPPIGAGTEAAALRVTLATDSTGVVSVDDGGGALTVDNAGTFATQATLQAGTAAFGKLAANSGVDIGDVDVLSVVPGVGATSLGKAEDAVHASGDTGVMALVVRNDLLAALAGADGDYAPLQVNATGALYIQEGAALDVSGATVTVDGSGVTQPVSHGALTELAAALNSSRLDVNIAASGATITVAAHAVTNAGTFATQATLQAGTAAFGKLSANSGVDIGDVDILSIVPGVAATNLGKAEDAAHTTGDVGVMSLGVRKDSGASIAGADGDYSPFQLDSSGNLRVNVAAGGGSGGTSETDDGAFTAGSGSGTPAMGFFSADTVDAGDVGVLAMDASRRLLVSIEADNVGIGGGTQYTEDDAAPTNPVGNAFLAQRDDALGGLTPAEGDWTHLYASATGALWVAVDGTVTVAAHAVTNTGTFATQVDGDALTALQLIDNIVGTADSVAGATDSGAVMLARRDDEKSAFGADGDYVIPTTDLFGALRTTQLPDATSEVKYAIIDAASSGNNTIQAAAGAGIKIRVLSAFLVSAGTVNARFESAADGTAMTGQMNLVVNSGFVLPFNPAGWFETADNALLNLELSAGVSVDGSVSYVEV